jgi:CheY-like chemotaxis protein
MDVRMPGMSGIEATRAIRAQAPEVCIIALTVYQEPDQEAAMLGAGAVAYVTKTSPVEELLAAIRGHYNDPFSRLKAQRS